MRFKAVSVLSTASIFACASVVGAQIVLNSASGPSCFSFGGDGVMSQPKGEFASNVGRGWGFGLNGMYRLDYKGYLAIRADAGGVQYGRERVDASFFGISGRVALDLETTNNIAWGAIGPQIMIPDGPFRPYANAAIAYTDFSTTSSLSDPSGQFQSASTQNAHDGSHAWVFGSGFQIPFGTTGAFNLGESITTADARRTSRRATSPTIRMERSRCTHVTARRIWCCGRLDSRSLFPRGQDISKCCRFSPPSSSRSRPSRCKSGITNKTALRPPGAIP